MAGTSPKRWTEAYRHVAYSELLLQIFSIQLNTHEGEAISQQEPAVTSTCSEETALIIYFFISSFVTCSK